MDLPPDETLNHHRLRPPGKTASVEVLNSLRPAVPRDRSSKVLKILGPAETRHIGLSSRVRQRGQWLRQGEKKPCSGITPMRSRDLTNPPPTITTSWAIFYPLQIFIADTVPNIPYCAIISPVKMPYTLWTYSRFRGVDRLNAWGGRESVWD